MRALVTGGTGYIGLNLVHHLMVSDIEVTVLVRESSPTQWLPDGVETCRGDVTDPGSVVEAAVRPDCDTIFHLAAVHGRFSNAETAGALDWERMKHVNVDGTANVINAAKEHGVDSVVFTSTVKAHPNITWEGSSPYVRSKIRAQELFDKSDHSFGYGIVNPTVVVGPRDYRLVRYQPYQFVESNIVLPPPLYFPIDINIVHVQDVVESLVHYAENPDDSAHVIAGPNISMRNYCQTIGSVSDSSSFVVPTPYAETFLPPMIDIGKKIGILPIGSEAFNWSDRDVPDNLTKSAPVRQRSVWDIAHDTYRWYSEMELL